MKLNLNKATKGAIVCFFVIATAQLGYSQLALNKVETNEAIITFEVETVDYGTIAQNSDGTRIVTFKNTGNAPLIITDVKSSCGCTVPTYSKTPILPNQKGEITVKYKTSKLGVFNKTITVLSNATEGTKKIRIKGEVVE